MSRLFERERRPALPIERCDYCRDEGVLDLAPTKEGLLACLPCRAAYERRCAAAMEQAKRVRS